MICLDYREQSPGLRVLTPRGEVAAESVEYLRKLLLGHLGPGEDHVREHHLLRCRRQLVEDVVDDHAKVPAAGATAGAEQIGVALRSTVTKHNLSLRVDGKNIDPGQPVRCRPVQPGNKPIPSTGDMSTRAHGIAGATGQGHVVKLVEVLL